MSWEDELNGLVEENSTPVEAPVVAIERRGRPPGVKNGQGKAYTPIVDWSPTHDLVVSLYVGLKTNIEIAEETGFSVARVSQVLNDPMGKKLIREAQTRMRERLFNRVEEGLVALCERSLDIVRETLEVEGLQHGTDFKKHQDKMAMEVLKGRGFLPGSVEGERRDRSPINEKLADRLVTALEKSNEAAELVNKKREIVIEEEIEEEAPTETVFTIVTKE